MCTVIDILHSQVFPLTTILTIHIQYMHFHLLETHIFCEMPSHIVVMEDVEVIVYFSLNPLNHNPSDPNSTGTW